MLAMAGSKGAWVEAESPAASGAAPSVAQLARRVDEHYNRPRTLSVQFMEVYRGMGIQRTESGTLLLAKPGRMRWNYDQPRGKLFVMDGKYAYSYAPGDAQAQRYPASKLDDFRSPLRLLLGHARIEKELANLSLTRDDDDFVIHGVPKGMQQRLAEVELAVTTDGVIHAIRWQEKDGSATEFHLTQEKVNLPLAAGTFIFQAPPGVVVVNGLPPI